MATVLAFVLALIQSGTTFEVQAVLVYGNKEVKPVPQTYFIVLDKNIESILHDVNVGCELPVVLPSEQMDGCPDVLATLSRIDIWMDQAKASRVRSLIQKHTVASAKTDSHGKMTLTSLPLNTRLWLFGTFQTTMSVRQLIWNVPLETLSVPTRRKVVLDNNNLHNPRQGLRNLTINIPRARRRSLTPHFILASDALSVFLETYARSKPTLWEGRIVSQMTSRRTHALELHDPTSKKRVRA